MSATKLFDVPTITRLQVIVENFRGGHLSIPDFQRPFVWSDKQRLQLFDSILKGLPIGSLLIWRTSKMIAIKESIEGFKLAAPVVEQTRNYVLDGQQRLFTLFAALSGARPEEGEPQRRWPIYLDLLADRAEDADESRFRFPRRNTDPPNTWLPLSALLNTRELFRFQRKLEGSPHEELLDRAEEIANIVRDYPLALVPILTDKLNLVTQSFQRINSAGSQMSEAHMLRALTYKETFDFSESFADLADDLPGRWADLGEQPFVNILKALCGLSIYQADVEKIQKAMEDDPELLARGGKGMRAAAEFASAHLHTLSPTSLPYIYQFVALAYAAANGANLEDHRQALERWFWVTAYTEFFTGMPAGQLRVVFAHLREICEGETAEPLPPNLTPTCSRVEEFRSTSVRSLLLMHRLARRQGERGDQLLTRGSETYMRLLVKGPASDPANRLLAAPEVQVALRKKLLNLDPADDELRQEHVLPPATDTVWTELRAAGSQRSHAARMRALAPVLTWRRQKLAHEEEATLRGLGLNLED